MNFEGLTTYFMNNDPAGVRILRKNNSALDVLVIPRTQLKAARDLGDFATRHGVYFLIDDKDGVDQPQIYAGKTENGIVRLDDHKYTKDFWSLAVMFLADEASFSLDVIRGLEKVSIAAIAKSKRYTYTNKVDPKYKINFLQQQTVDRYFEEIVFVLKTLGIDLDPTEDGDKGDWHTTRNGICAYGRYAVGKFEVLPGSVIDFSRPVTGENYNKLRAKLLASGGIVEKPKGTFVLQTTLSFKTPSGASDFVLGGSTNGWAEWKNEAGKPLDILRK